MAFFKCKGKTLYRWEKWNSVPTYAQASRYQYDDMTPFFTGTGFSWMYGNYNSYTFDSATGQFTGVGNGFQVGTTSDSSFRFSGVGLYPNHIGTAPEIVISNGTPYYYMTSTMMRFYSWNQGATKCWSYISSYYKGSTSYGIIASTDKNQYPDNGRADDGYWYVKVA